MSEHKYIIKPSPDARHFYPLIEPAVGSLLPVDQFPQNEKSPELFKPLTLRGTTFANRIFVSPMCQYSSDNGHATDYHFVHAGQWAIGGAGAIMLESSAVVPEGRISPQDSGIWADSHIEPFKRIVDFTHAQGVKIGIQLGHAGRKASTLAMYVTDSLLPGQSATRNYATTEEGGWPEDVWGPTDQPWAEDYCKPKPLTEEKMDYIEKAFVDAIGRCKKIGFDFIEIHGAHGYLIHSLLSPLTNTRTDKWGGQAFENRARLPLRIIRAAREAWPDKPLFARFSATDWAEGPERAPDGKWLQWGIEQTNMLVGELTKIGVDLIDVSSGGNWKQQKITGVGPGYQVPFAAAIKAAHPDVAVAAVGLIVTPQQAEDVIKESKADVVFLAREMDRTPTFALRAAEALGVAVKTIPQTERAWSRMLSPHAPHTPV